MSPLRSSLPTRWRLPSRWALALVTCAVAAVPSHARAGVYDDDKENCQVNYLDTWVQTPPAPALVEKYGVKFQTERRLDKLPNGTPATGQGARIMLAAQDVLPKSLDPDYETWLAEWQIYKSESTRLHAEWDGAGPETPKAITERITQIDRLLDDARARVEKGLLALGNDKEMHKLLLSRYDPDPKKWPTPEVNETDQLGQIPAVAISVKGVDCPNLDGNPGPCEAGMLICVLRKKLYRLTYWVWRPSKSEGHLRNEAEEIVMNFQFIKTTAIPRKKDDKPALPPGPAGDSPSGPELDEKLVTELPMEFSILKPKGWKPLPFDRSKESEKFFGFRFSVSDSSRAEISVDCLVYRVGTSGFVLDTYLVGLWPSFLALHPNGVLQTYPFLVYNEKNPFLSLPNLEKKINLKRPPPPGKDKDPEKFSKDDLERMGVITETKQVILDKQKVRACWRFCMFGQAMSGIGDEIGIHYCFATSRREYLIRVYIRKDALVKWGPDLKKLLDSFRFTEAPK